jgi:membrane protease YdiL (CAAX protease family)
MSDLGSGFREPAWEGHATTVPEPGAAPRKLPSRLVVNLYLVVGIALLILNSRLDVGTLGRYGLGILLEIVLALLALLFMRLERLDIRATGRFRRVDLQPMLLALASVPGLWIAGIALNLLSALIFGYTTPVTPTQFPGNALEAVALALTTVVVAPICEEIMFRSYVQRAYERRGIWTGIVVGGLIFSLYHLRFQGVFALIPVALGLGFVVWRTGSVYPAMAMHAAFNTIATLVLISTSFLSAQVTGMLTVTVACVGFLVAPLSLVALWMLWRRSSPEPQPERVPAAPLPSPALRWLWVVPAVALLAIYGYAAANEVLVQRYPETVLDDPLDLVPPEAWEEEVVWTYVVQNLLGRELGAATCSRLPREADYLIECDAGYEGFDIAGELPGLGQQLEGFDWSDLPFNIPGFGSVFRTGPQNWTLSASWARQALELTALDLSIDASLTGPVTLQFAGGEQGPVIRQPGEETRTLPVDGEPLLMLHEWAWRFGALPFQLPYGGPVTVVEVDATGDAASYRGFLRVAGGEPAWTPAGNTISWRVTLSWEDGAGERQTRSAWYAAEAPHTLVRYDDGIVSYLLSSMETGP